MCQTKLWVSAISIANAVAHKYRPAIIRLNTASAPNCTIIPAAPTALNLHHRTNPLRVTALADRAAPCAAAPRSQPSQTSPPPQWPHPHRITRIDAQTPSSMDSAAVPDSPRSTESSVPSDQIVPVTSQTAPAYTSPDSSPPLKAGTRPASQAPSASAPAPKSPARPATRPTQRYPPCDPRRSRTAASVAAAPAPASRPDCRPASSAQCTRLSATAPADPIAQAHSQGPRPPARSAPVQSAGPTSPSRAPAPPSTAKPASPPAPSATDSPEAPAQILRALPLHS